jgi:predicted SAM-dependent methyltransferase
MLKLDLGCGNEKQKRKGFFGIDINLRYRPDLVVDCDKGLPFKDGVADEINMDNSLEHFHNPFLVLQESYRVLQKGGTIRIVVPNVQFVPFLILAWFGDILKIWNLWMRSPWKRERTIHTTLWTREVIRLLLERVGFEIVSARGFYLGKEIEVIAVKP